MKKTITALLASLCLQAFAQDVPHDLMQAVYDEVKTPYKYGMVVAPNDNYHKFDCPTVFRQGDFWYMTYVCYDGKDGTDGRGYETWLAKSPDLLHWETLGRILELPHAIIEKNGTPYPSKLWDQNQRGGFPALIDYNWGGTYEMQAYKGRHYLTYIGGPGTGYEAVNAPLSIGIASTAADISTAHQWDTQTRPLMSYDDKEAQWWEHMTQYKSTIYWIKDKAQRIEGEQQYPFVMFYNAGGKDDTHPKGERIGIALSKDMKHWKRYQGNPVFAHDSDGTITGDAQIVRMGDLWVMFYFSAFNPTRPYNAYNTFAASTDLIHWQDWDGDDLITPSKPYDEMFAHKSCLVKHNGVVYHYYCAVNNAGQRGIAVATSMPMGRSEVHFPSPEPTGRRLLTPLNADWQVSIVGQNESPAQVSLPHNLDDYYGYRQLRHGNLHGSAIYSKDFTMSKRPDRQYFLQFEGVGTYATVTLNGHEYPRELVGRTVWTLDVTDALLDGDNRLDVRVDHPSMQTESPWVCGGCSSEWGFSEGSQPFGIFRPVTLVATDKLRIEPFGVHIWSNDACDSIFIDTELKNYSAQTVTAELVNKLAQKSGKQVCRLARQVTLAPGEARTFRQHSPVADAHRWSLDDPYLYTLTTMVKRDGKTTDDLRTPFGMRCLRWPLSTDSGLPSASAGRFYLNGRPLFINGTCEYEHLLGQSHAFSHEQIAARIKMIRHAGFNALREAHQPHNLYYQQLTDEQGLLFWSQFSAHIWYDTPQFRDNFKRLLTRWVKERRNSPSVVLWGLQNESVLPREFAQECSSIIRSLDPTASTQRLITTCNGGEGTDWNVIQNWSGTYGGDADNYGNELRQPGQLLNGEYGAWRTIDLHGSDKYSEESFTALLKKKATLAQNAADGVCGHFQWLFASHDNPGRTQPDGALRRIDKIGPVNHKGLLTIWEEPTPAYYMYKGLTEATEEPRRHSLPTAADRCRDLLRGMPGHHYLYRINCGGDALHDSFCQQWSADDSLLSHSWGHDFTGMHPYQASQRHISTPVRGLTSTAPLCEGEDAKLFQYFRYGRHRLWYDLAVDSSDASYRIELYFIEPWHGKDSSSPDDDYEGLRIFSVAVNDSTVISDLDPWAEAGYCGALKRVVYAPAKNGRLRISFPQVKAGQAVIAAIAVSREAGPHDSQAPADSTGQHWRQKLDSGPHCWQKLDSDTVARLPKSELPDDTDLRPATVYEPEKSGKGRPATFIVKPGVGQEYALRFRYMNTSGQPVAARLLIVDSKNSTLVDRELSFPPTPAKFKMLSTTTGTQINAGTYRVTIDAAGLEFKNLEMQ